MRRLIPVPAVVLTILLGLAQPAGNQELSANRPPPSIQVSTDTPPTEAVKPPAKPTPANGAKLSQLEYEGWRQYHVHCARCHGQDALPNPVAANLLLSVGPGGAANSEKKFTDIVTAGRPARGMPAFKDVLTADQIKAIYAYVKGRAEKRIPPGRPERPA
jgi:polar amino acid transport system substrate-binding protein